MKVAGDGIEAPPAGSEIARDAVSLPVAVARRLGALGSVRLFRCGFSSLLTRRTARLSLGDGTFGGRRELAIGHAAKGPANRWPVNPLGVRRCVLPRPLEGWASPSHISADQEFKPLRRPLEKTNELLPHRHAAGRPDRSGEHT